MLDSSMMAAAVPPPVLDVSMSQLDTWSRCDRKFYYRHVRGLVPIGVNDNMQWGSMFHLAAQHYYRGIKGALSESNALSNAHWAIDHTKIIENKHHGDTVITLDNDKLTALHDAFDFYYQNVARFDDWDEIVTVEDSLYMIVGVDNHPLMRIRSTIDLLARRNRKLALVDHKSTGDVEKNMEFLKLDFQAREYPLAVRTYYGEDPVFCYNMISRDVPPGFGHRSLLTDSGKRRSADTLANMQRTERYVRREWITYSAEQHASFERELVGIAMMIYQQKQLGIWPRKLVKAAGMGCDSCSYFAVCQAELDGREFDDDAGIITMSFTKDPKVLPKTPDRIILPGLLGNPFQG